MSVFYVKSAWPEDQGRVNGRGDPRSAAPKRACRFAPFEGTPQDRNARARARILGTTATKAAAAR